jgi:hypothetical protein
MFDVARGSEPCTATRGEGNEGMRSPAKLLFKQKLDHRCVAGVQSELIFPRGKLSFLYRSSAMKSIIEVGTSSQSAIEVRTGSSRNMNQFREFMSFGEAAPRPPPPLHASSSGCAVARWVAGRRRRRRRWWWWWRWWGTGGHQWRSAQQDAAAATNDSQLVIKHA